MNKLPSILIQYIYKFLDEKQNVSSSILSKKFHDYTTKTKEYILSHTKMKWRTLVNKQNYQRYKNEIDIIIKDELISEARYVCIDMRYLTECDLVTYLMEQIPNISELLNKYRCFSVDKTWEPLIEYPKDDDKKLIENNSILLLDNKDIVSYIRINKLKGLDLVTNPLCYYAFKDVNKNLYDDDLHIPDYEFRYHFHFQSILITLHRFIMSDDIVYNKLIEFYGHKNYINMIFDEMSCYKEYRQDINKPYLFKNPDQIEVIE